MLTAALLVCEQQAVAEGFQIIGELSVTGLGRAFAGGSLPADDASAVFFNPADMMLLDGNRAQAGLSYLATNAPFSNTGSTQTFPSRRGPVTAPSTGPDSDAGVEIFVPNFYFIGEVNDQVKLGLGITVPYGLKTEYDGNWVGRYHALGSELKTIDINPGIAYRVNEHFSVGAGFSAQYIDVTLSKAVFTGPSKPDGYAEVTADNWGYGFNLGATYEFDATTRAGLSYRYGIDHSLEGDLSVKNVPGRSGTMPGSADLQLPDTIGLALYKRFNEEWAVMAGARWTQWSRFDQLRISFANGQEDVTQENWNDSWAFSLGASYYYQPNWTFRVGYAYDQTPIPSPEYRTPRIPSNSRQWLSVGASYRPIKNLSLDVGYAHLFFQDASLVNTISLPTNTPGVVVTDTLRGDYNGSSADIVGVQFSWSF